MGRQAGDNNRETIGREWEDNWKISGRQVGHRRHKKTMWDKWKTRGRPIRPAVGEKSKKSGRHPGVGRQLSDRWETRFQWKTQWEAQCETKWETKQETKWETKWKSRCGQTETRGIEVGNGGEITGRQWGDNRKTMGYSWKTSVKQTWDEREAPEIHLGNNRETIGIWSGDNWETAGRHSGRQGSKMFQGSSGDTIGEKTGRQLRDSWRNTMGDNWQTRFQGSWWQVENTLENTGAAHWLQQQIAGLVPAPRNTRAKHGHGSALASSTQVMGYRKALASKTIHKIIIDYTSINWCQWSGRHHKKWSRCH